MSTGNTHTHTHTHRKCTTVTGKGHTEDSAYRNAFVRQC